MEQKRKLEKELYSSINLEGNVKKFQLLWNRICADKDFLKEAIKVQKNSCGEEQLTYPFIGECILRFRQDVPEDIVSQLTHLVFSNSMIASIYIYNSACQIKGLEKQSFLLLGLLNQKIFLNHQEKRFAENECLNNLAVHGAGSHDVRYYLIRNGNWTYEEKKQFICRSYSEEEWSAYLEEWEWEIVYCSEDYKSGLEKECLYNYSYQEILKIFKNEKVANQIYANIQFLRMLRQMRPVSQGKLKEL